MFETSGLSHGGYHPVPPGEVTGRHAVFGGIVAGLTEEVLADLDAMTRSFDAESIHGLRVDISRLRIALSALPAGLPKHKVGKLRRELKWLKRQLAPAREWAVFIDRHKFYGDGPLGDVGMEQLATHSQARHAKAVGLAAVALMSARCSTLQVSLARLAARLPAVAAGSGIPLTPEQRQSRKLRAAAAEVLDEQLARLEKRARHLDQLALPELHRVRIGVKHLRYLCELLQPLYGDRAAASLGALAELQKTLGSIQDGVSARELASDLEKRLGTRVSLASESIISNYERRLKHLRRRLRRQWTAFRQLGAFWRAEVASG